MPAVHQVERPLGAPSDDNGGLCVVCVDTPASAGVLHGGSVRRCLCAACAQEYKDRSIPECPLCKAPIERVLLVYI